MVTMALKLLHLVPTSRFGITRCQVTAAHRCVSHGCALTYRHSQANTNVHNQADSVFSGISTFGRLPYAQCLAAKSDIKYDIAFIGMSDAIL